MQAQCPSCGNLIHYKSENSAYLVCSACQTLVARKDVRVEAVGKVGALQADGSVIRIGTQGIFEGKSFEVVGRIQVALGPVEQPDTIWNEWCAHFSDGRTGWVGEARGEYFVSFHEKASGIPSRSLIDTGRLLNLGDRTAVVTSVSQGTAVGFEGELPFVMDTHYQATFADLATASDLAGTIDYSEDPPLLFKGRWCSLADLKLRGLRSGDEEDSGGARLAEANLKTLKCHSCGAPHELRAGGISQTLVCQFCDTAMDLTQDATFAKVLKFEQLQAKTPALIPLGSEATLPEGKVTCIGYLRRSCFIDGVTYRWSEYLLYDVAVGYRWLTESNGHWTLLAPLHQVPLFPGAEKRPVGHPYAGSVVHDGRTYQHFQKTTAQVDYVAGEFYWRIRLGERAEVHDYVDSPRLLSAEVGSQEYNWSQGSYLTGAEVWKLFKLPGKPPTPVGVANNQLNPYQTTASRRWTLFLCSCLLACGFLMFRAVSVQRPFFDQSWAYKDYEPDRVQVVPVTVPPGQHNLYIQGFSPNLQDRWLYLLISLIQEDTGLVKDTAITLYDERGVDADGSWSEAVRRAGVSLAHVSGGKYLLRIEPQSNRNTAREPEGAGPVRSVPAEVFRYHLTIEQDHPQWGYFWLLVFLGILPAMWSQWRKSSFETSRWSQSDYGS